MVPPSIPDLDEKGNRRGLGKWGRSIGDQTQAILILDVSADAIGLGGGCAGGTYGFPLIDEQYRSSRCGLTRSQRKKGGHSQKEK